MGSYKQQGQKLVRKTGICYQRDNITLLLWNVVSDWRKRGKYILSGMGFEDRREVPCNSIASEF
uniref:Uncharacterized protein n=1 Tax=Magallana gigas TaxID=29159 RepID=K1PMF5_MAGGI